MAQIIFETFNAQGLYISDSSLLIPIANGKFSAIGLDLGADTISFYPVYDGHTIKDAIIKYNFGENALT